jgi:hypothetical protein
MLLFIMSFFADSSIGHFSEQALSATDFRRLAACDQFRVTGCSSGRTALINQQQKRCILVAEMIFYTISQAVGELTIGCGETVRGGLSILEFYVKLTAKRLGYIV